MCLQWQEKDVQRIHGTELGNLPKEVRSEWLVGKVEFRLVRMSVMRKEGSDWDLKAELIL